MALPSELKKQRWCVSRPFEGKIEVFNKENGKIICTLDISDFRNKKEAKQIATLVSFAPELFALCCCDILAELRNLQSLSEE